MQEGDIVYHKVTNEKGKIIEIRGKDIFVEWEGSKSKVAYVENELVKGKEEISPPEKSEDEIVPEVKKKKRGRRKNVR